MIPYGTKVAVYWNVTKKCYSVVSKGRVIAHVKKINLKDVHYRVNAAGRKRVIAERRKNVHAKIHGYVSRIGRRRDSEKPKRVRYNPYDNVGFVTSKVHQTIIHSSDYCRLLEGGRVEAYGVQR